MAKNDKKAREARAKELKKEIAQLKKGKPKAKPRAKSKSAKVQKPAAPPAPASVSVGDESPRDFIQRRMAELDQEAKKSNKK